MMLRSVKYSIVLVLLCGLALAACDLQGFADEKTEGLQQTIDAQVTATFEAVSKSSTPTREPTSTTTSKPPTGTITGELNYPSEGIPPQRVIAFDYEDPETYFMVEVLDDRTYTLEVEPGTYVVVAYPITPDGESLSPDLAGGYSQAVLCGLTVECEDHSLVPIEVEAGEVVEGINPMDWYLPPGEDLWPDDPVKGETGAVTGDLGFPSEYIPPLRVVAFDVFNGDYFFVDTERNQAEYRLDDLPVGTYHVLAYVREQGPDIPGAYTKAVICGLRTDCEDHSLVDVEVSAGEVVEDIDPIDFYLHPEDWDWPENPTKE